MGGGGGGGWWSGSQTEIELGREKISGDDILLETPFSAHLVTYEKASTLPIIRVVELAMKHYDKEMGDHLFNLYKFIKANYNKYVQLIGGAIGAKACATIKRGDKVYTIADDVPLLYFLTGEYDHLRVESVRIV